MLKAGYLGTAMIFTIIGLQTKNADWFGMALGYTIAVQCMQMLDKRKE